MNRMKRRVARPRLWVEELEPRVVLSTLLTTSTNWSGYAVQTSLTAPANNAVTAVYGSWTVPAVTGSPGTTAYSSVWVGIDGYSSGTVEQIGTESDWSNGTPVYYAWYEMYPRNSVTVTRLVVQPNDAISASVTYVRGRFTLQITDVTSGQSFKTTQALRGAQRSSAEWVVEAPSNGFGVLPLADFGTATFTNASATLTVAGKSTTGPIDNPAWQNASINMVTSGNATQASTGGLTDSGNTSSFTVTYAAPLTPTPTPTPPSGHHHWWWWSTMDGNVMTVFVPRLGVPANNAVFTNYGTTAAPAANGNAAPSVMLGGQPASVPVMPLMMGFRAFGLGDEAGSVTDGEAPMPPMGRPMAPSAPMPNRQMPPMVIPLVPPPAVGNPQPPEGSEQAPALGTGLGAVDHAPAERRELRTGSVGKALLALVGLAGFIAFRREREPDESPRQRPRPERMA